MVVPVAASRSTRSTVLPLQATCTPSTSPYVVVKPGVPSTTIVAPPETRSPDARLAQPQAVGDVVTLRVPLVLVAAGEVEHLDEVVGHREHDLEALEVVVVATGVGQACRTRSAPPVSDSTSVTRASPAVLSSSSRRSTPSTSSRELQSKRVDQSRPPAR